MPLIGAFLLGGIVVNYYVDLLTVTFNQSIRCSKSFPF
jgi:hypothetical protein